MQLVVGRIGRPHGITGEVAVLVHTDDVERRFAPGSVLETDPPAHGPLTLDSARWHSGRLLVRFAGVADRTAAEALRGTLLVVDSASSAPHEDPEDFWDHELVGLRAVTPADESIGEVVDVLHPPGGDLLVVSTAQGEKLIPFVSAIVPDVDLASHRLVVDAPEGLLDL